MATDFNIFKIQFIKSSFYQDFGDTFWSQGTQHRKWSFNVFYDNRRILVKPNVGKKALWVPVSTFNQWTLAYLTFPPGE